MCLLQQSKTDLRKDVIALNKYTKEVKELFKMNYSADTRAKNYIKQPGINSDWN